MGWTDTRVLSGYVEDPADIPVAFTHAWMARDAKSLAELFSKDAEFVNVVGLWWHDRAAIEAAHDYGLSTFFSNSTLRPGVIRTKRLGKDVAVVQCRFTLTGQTHPNGDVGGTRRTILTFVTHRHGDSWPIVVAQNTDIVEGAESMVRSDVLKPADYRQ